MPPKIYICRLGHAERQHIRRRNGELLLSCVPYTLSPVLSLRSVPVGHETHTRRYMRIFATDRIYNTVNMIDVLNRFTRSDPKLYLPHPYLHITPRIAFNGWSPDFCAVAAAICAGTSWGCVGVEHPSACACVCVCVGDAMTLMVAYAVLRTHPRDAASVRAARAPRTALTSSPGTGVGVV